MASTHRGSAPVSPGSTDYPLSNSQPSEPSDQPLPDVGDLPGSPAYFGYTGATAEADLISNAGEAETGPGDPPGSAAYFGLAEAASCGPDGAELPLPTVGEPPGGNSYYGADSTEYPLSNSQPSEPTDQPPLDVGDLPGSPAYFGYTGATAEADLISSADEAETGPGDPPGSAAYFGLAEAASRGPDGAELPLPTVGEPPGGNSYYGAG